MVQHRGTRKTGAPRPPHTSLLSTLTTYSVTRHVAAHPVIPHTCAFVCAMWHPPQKQYTQARDIVKSVAVDRLDGEVGGVYMLLFALHTPILMSYMI